MASIFDNFLNQVTTGDTVKDWDHASRLYVANNYELAPKNSFLFHVYFDLNPNAIKLNKVDAPGRQTELGMLVKSVQLPKFSAEMDVLNAYNRPHVIQKKMKHSPVQIEFHDDSADVVRNFWFDYYTYYYRNSDYSSSSDLSPYEQTHKEITNPRQFKDWGYSVRGSTTGSNIAAPYLTAIRIYSLHNKRFSAYTLVNPLIKDFGHGQHDSSNSESMSHSMSVEYETVLYSQGAVSQSNVRGFADLHYDKRPSPLSAAGGGTQSILGPGGIAESAGEIFEDLQAGNFGAALFKGARVTNGLKGANVGAMAGVAAASLGKGILGSLGGTGVSNPFGSVAIPNLGGAWTALGGVASGVAAGNNLGTTLTGAAGIASAAAGAGPLAGIVDQVKNTATGVGTQIASATAQAGLGIRLAGAALNPNGIVDPNMPGGNLEA